MLSVMYFVVSVMIIALGMIHLAASPKFYAHLTSAALWFASGGVSIILMGALNLLRRAYGENAFGLRLVYVITNIVMTCFALLEGYVSRASVVQFVIVLGLMGSATVLSFLRVAQLTQVKTDR